MTQSAKRAKILDYPMIVLRILAVIGIIVHLFLGFFVSVISPWIFFTTAALLALLVVREMYDDMARQFFQLKSDTLEEQCPPPPMREATVIDNSFARPMLAHRIEDAEPVETYEDEFDRGDNDRPKTETIRP